MSQHFGQGQGPWTPSKLKINDYPISAVETAQPTDRTKGVPVNKWRRILFSVHPVSPDINDAGAVGWRLQIKIWRYKELAREGTGRPAGQWFAEEVVTISMDGDVANGGPMEYDLPTWDAEQMYFQAVASDGPDTWSAMVTTWGLVPRVTEDGRSCECESGGGSASSSSGSIVVANMFDLIAHQDYTYSNLRADFDAVRSGATTIDLSKVDFPIDERQILAIGLKRTGITSQTRMWYRDKDLFVDYAAATGRITVGGFVINATDAVEVYIEGPSKIDDLLNQARRVLQINPDSKLVTLDGNIVQTMAEGAGVEYVPLNMGQDGLHYLSLHHNCNGDAYVTIEGTNDLDRDGSERWDDITQEQTGLTQIDATTRDVVMPQTWCGWRRIRFVLNSGATGGTVDLFVMRSAYGDLWNPQAYEAEVLQLAGPQIMGEPRSVQAAALTQGEAGRFVTNLYKEIVNSAFIWATQANRTEEDDPTDTRDNTEVLAEVTGQGDGTYDYFFDMAHFTKTGIQIENTDGVAGDNTYTIWGSLQDDGTAPNAVAYQNITQFGCDNMTAANAASYTADVLLQTNAAGLSYKWIRVRVIRANDGDNTDGAWTIYARPLYH